MNVRSSNTRAAELLRLVHEQPGISRADAARTLGVGTGAATELVAGLAAGRLVAQRPAPPSGGRGRPTTVLGPHPEGPVVIAVSVTYSAWRTEAVTIGGGAFEAASVAHRGLSAERAMTELRQALEQMRGRYGSRIRGVGVSAPGIVRDGRLIEATTMGWSDVDLVLSHPGEVFIAGNDASLAGAAESARGNAAGSSIALHFRVDAGLGGSMVDRGSTFKGATGVAGEFGHLPFGDPEVRCPCGAFGCWGNSLDGLALARLLGAPEPADSVGFFLQVTQLARAGDAKATAAIAEVAARLGRGIAGLVNGLDADVVTVGGLAALMMEVAGDRVEHGYRAGLMSFRLAAAPPILTSALGEDGPLIGAAEEVWAQLWGPLAARR